MKPAPEQAIALGRDLSLDRAADRVLHTDLHYANVLAGQRQPWAVIDPKPVNGDPHYEIAPMLWNRWDEIAADVRDGVRRRFWTLVDTRPVSTRTAPGLGDRPDGAQRHVGGSGAGGSGLAWIGWHRGGQGGAGLKSRHATQVLQL